MTQRALLSALVVLSFACAPDPKVVAERTAVDVQSLVREAWVTAEGSNGWASLDSSLLALGVSAESRSTSMRVPAVTSLDTGLDSLKKRVDRIFAESNIIDRSGGALTFQVRGVDVCTDDNGALNADCAASVDRQQLFVKASGDLDLALLVGAEKNEIFSLEIRKNASIAVVVDLARSMAAMSSLQSAQQGMTVTYSFNAKGKVEWRLAKNGKDDFTLSSSVLSPVTSEMTGTDGVTRTATIGAKSPVASIRVEGPAKRATLVYGAGEVRYAGLLRDLLNDEAFASRPVDVFFAGLGATLIFEDGKNARLEGAGLGSTTSTIKSGNDVLFSIDFNKDRGRTVAATWEPTAAGFKLNFTPGLQLDARVALGVLASATYAVAPEHQNATYSASFLAPGKTPSVEFFTNRSTSGAPFGRILEGELKLSVDDAQVAARTFAAPSCLASFDGMTTNTYVESVVAVDCP
ncbi:MAG: hypothetical protein Q8N23_08980 [Archangium sp.]|nr:hypothetical protein [Archangium sp.]MDP3152791.1 hypothetical protein [Archangium sp.]MDP3573578.1 hypothetical protein [Archangium sp.]